MATPAQDVKRPRDDSDAFNDDHVEQKRAKLAEQEPGEQQQQRQQQQHLSVLPVPAVGDHIEASTLLPALQQLLSVYKVSYCASSTSNSAMHLLNCCCT
jgi:hypothetical protein